MKKKIFSILALTLVFAMAITMLSTVSATDTEVTGKGTVTDVITANQVSEGDGTVTLTYTSAQLNNLKWYDKDDDTGVDGLERPGSGWWIGVKVTAPDSVTKANVANAKYKYSTSPEFSFKNALDDPNAESNFCCTHWIGINNNHITPHNSIFTLETLTYDWDGDGDTDLTVIVKVDPTDVVLTENPTLPSESRMVTVDVDGTIFTLLKGSSLEEGLSASDLEILESMIPENGILVDTETDEEFGLDTVIDTNKYLTIKVIETPAETPETPAPEAPADELDNTPKTGVVDTTLAVAIIASISLAGIVAIKKYSK